MGQDLSEVEGSDTRLLAVQGSFDVHEAGVVAGGADGSPGIEDGGGFFCEHGRGGGGVLDGEGTSKAAAAAEFRGREFDQVDAADSAKEAKGTVGEVEAAKSVATGVVGNTVGVEGADIFEAEAVGEEFGELVEVGEKGLDLGGEGGMLELGRHFGVMIADHGYAGGGGNDDGFRVSELLREALE